MNEFDVPYVDADLPPFGVYQVPGGGQMFRQYVMPECLMQADAVVNVQRMKDHAFMGITLTLKNLFGVGPYEGTRRPVPAVFPPPGAHALYVVRLGEIV